jgi:hypothetical protein
MIEFIWCMLSGVHDLDACIQRDRACNLRGTRSSVSAVAAQAKAKAKVEATKALAQLYAASRLYINFFQPSIASGLPAWCTKPLGAGVTPSRRWIVLREPALRFLER